MKKKRKGHSHGDGFNLKNIILGGQDGVVNILGLVLGVAVATRNPGIVIISGLASTFAESISMGAVAYTSSKAAKDYYLSRMVKEEQLIKDKPHVARKELKHIVRKRGFKGRTLDMIVNKIASSRKMMLSTLLSEELELSPEEYKSPFRNALIVGFASLIGSLVPLVPFFFFSVNLGIYFSILLCIAVLFVTGAYKATITIGSWKRAGLEMALIGVLAALTGYGIGLLLGMIPY